MITFADAPPPGTGLYIDYLHRPPRASGWRAVDIRDYSRALAPAWLNDADRWHRQLSAIAASRSRWWWLMPGSRLTLWYPHNLKPLFFAAAVAEAAEANGGAGLWIAGCPAEAREYIEEWAAAARIEVRAADAAPAEPPAPARASRLRPLAAALASAFRAPRRPVLQARTVVFSHSLDLDVVRRSGDHFFGRVFDGEAGRDVLWFYDTPRAASAALTRQLEAMGRRAVVAASLLRAGDLWFAFHEAGAARQALDRLDPPDARIGRLVSRAFPRRFVAATVTGQAPVETLLLYRAMRRCLARSGATALVFPYEEKGLERALVAAAAGAGRPITTVAFAHAAYNEGHQYVRHRGAGDPPRASRLAVTGPVAADWFSACGVPPERMDVVGSPRTPANSPARAPESGRPLRVLFLSGYGSELRLLAVMAAARADLLAGSELRIRRYPYAWMAEQDAALDDLRAAGVRCETVEGDLGAQIADADLVFFASTSAGIEAMIRGRFAARLALDDIATISPIQGKGFGDAVPECATADDVRALIDRVRAMAPDEYARQVEAQRVAARRLYAPVDQAAWAAAVRADARADAKGEQS